MPQSPNPPPDAVYIGKIWHPNTQKWHPVYIAPELRAYAPIARAIVAERGGQVAGGQQPAKGGRR